MGTIYLNEETYGGGGGGGGGFTADVLCTASSTQATYALSHNISDYDLIYVQTTNGSGYTSSSIFLATELYNAIGLSKQFCVCNESEVNYFRVDSDSQLSRFVERTQFIERIVGIKF